MEPSGLALALLWLLAAAVAMPLYAIPAYRVARLAYLAGTRGARLVGRNWLVKGIVGVVMCLFILITVLVAVFFPGFFANSLSYILLTAIPLLLLAEGIYLFAVVRGFDGR